MNTANLPAGMTHPDAISKWLVITRAAVFSMTATSGLIGALLAVGAMRLTGRGERRTGCTSILAVVGLVVAHAANNMINDYFDLEGGVDTDDYVRALYAPHPILSGWVTKRQLGAAILIANAVDLAIMLFLTAARGPLVIAFALAGLFISVFYVAPPIRLKHHGLGEPGVFIVWGPLMAVGTFFVATGADPGLDVDRLPALRDPRDDRPLREAHRQDRRRHEEGRPNAAGHPRRTAGARRRAGPDDRVLPDRGRRGARRLDRAVGRSRPARPPAARVASLRTFSRPRDRSRRRTATSAGRCGSSARRSSTPGAPAGCSSSACSSTRCCRSTCPGSAAVPSDLATLGAGVPSRQDGHSRAIQDRRSRRRPGDPLLPLG